MDHNADMVGIVECRRGAIERGGIEVPLRGSELPNEFRKVTPVFLVAGTTAFSGEIDVNVIGPAVQKKDRRAIGWAGFGVSPAQDACLDLLERAERGWRLRLVRDQFILLGSACFSVRRPGESELCGSDSHRRHAE